MNFAVNICVYHGDKVCLLDAALNSILTQSLLPSSIILSQDGPISDSLSLVISEYKVLFEEKAINFCWLISKENKGHGFARNLALENTKEDLIILCDSDDVNETNKFQVLYSMLINGADACGGQILEVSTTTGNIFGRRVVPLSNDDIYDDLKIRCPMNLTTCGFKKSSLVSVGGFGLIPFNEDYELWIKFCKSGFVLENSSLDLVKVSVDDNYFSRRAGFKYFKSELSIQILLYKCGFISLYVFIKNISIRFFIQILLPNYFRKWIFLKYARK